MESQTFLPSSADKLEKVAGYDGDSGQLVGGGHIDVEEEGVVSIVGAA